LNAQGVQIARIVVNIAKKPRNWKEKRKPMGRKPNPHYTVDPDHQDALEALGTQGEAGSGLNRPDPAPI